MKVTIKLPFPQGAKILVEVGEKVDHSTILAESNPANSEETILLSQLLHVNSSSIHHYLKKRVDQEVSVGDLLAEKKSLFSSSRVKSPIAGRIKEIDLKQGTLTLITSSSERSAKVTSPILGKIVHIGKDYLEVEFLGNIIRIHKGDGDEAIGKLIYFSTEMVEIFDVDKEVDKCIVLAKTVKEESVVKLEVLGAKGLITQKIISSSTLPWAQVDEEDFKVLTASCDKTIWLRPAEKEIVIID